LYAAERPTRKRACAFTTSCRMRMGLIGFEAGVGKLVERVGCWGWGSWSERRVGWLWRGVGGDALIRGVKRTGGDGGGGEKCEEGIQFSERDRERDREVNIERKESDFSLTFPTLPSLNSHPPPLLLPLLPSFPRDKLAINCCLSWNVRYWFVMPGLKMIRMFRIPRSVQLSLHTNSPT
jgi:hypothetical protein